MGKKQHTLLKHRVRAIHRATFAEVESRRRLLLWLEDSAECFSAEDLQVAPRQTLIGRRQPTLYDRDLPLFLRVVGVDVFADEVARPHLRQLFILIRHSIPSRPLV